MTAPGEVAGPLEPLAAGVARALVVDDEPAVRHALRRILAQMGFTTIEAADGAEAVSLLERDGTPTLVVSDLRMPGVDGLDLLRIVRERWPDTSVIMLSGMAETSVAIECLHEGAADFLLKPVSLGELQERVTRVLEKRALVLQNRLYQQYLERRVAEQAERIGKLFLEGVQLLARALEAKDAYTSGHSIRVSHYAVATAARLGLRGLALDHIRLGGELHDIGKIGTREALLHKPSALTPEERNQIAEHPALGEQMLQPIARESPTVLRIVRSHHERIDGRGFPDGLAGPGIPMEARIVAVADSFDAMTTLRPYRAPLTPEAAIEELTRVAGSQLDPDAVAAFSAAFPDPTLLPLSA
jgi:putative nucleotidyltransferase with HDIG domain